MSKNQKTITFNKVLTLAFCLTVFTYICIRAYLLSFTHDESLSFTLTQGDNTWSNTANNHVLNTYLMKVTGFIFGYSELSLRLPNILAFIVYSFAIYKIISLNKNTPYLIFFICLAVLNPFLLEYFSLARGYGISIGFMMMSIYYLIRNGNDYMSFKLLLNDFISASVFASLAMFANLNLINFFIAVLLIFAFKFWIFQTKKPTDTNTKKFIKTLLIILIPLLLGMWRLIVLKKNNQLYFGSNSLNESFNSLIDSSIYFPTPPLWINTFILITIVLLVVLSLILLVVKKNYNSIIFIPTILIVIITFGLLFESLVFDAKYPLERTSLFYIPILSLFIYQLLIHLSKNYWIKLMFVIVVVLTTIPLAFNFYKGINFSITKGWRFDSHTKEAMLIVKNKTSNINKPYTISNHWLFEPSINYYISIWELNVSPANREGVKPESDFIYRLEDNSKIDNFYSLQKYLDINSELLSKETLIK